MLGLTVLVSQVLKFHLLDMHISSNAAEKSEKEDYSARCQSMMPEQREGRRSLNRDMRSMNSFVLKFRYHIVRSKKVEEHD